MLRRHRVKLQPWTDSIGILIHFPNFSFSQISMLLEDKELKKSIPLQLNRGKGRASAKRNQKINSKNHEIFQKFQSHYPRLWIQDHTSEQNFGTTLSNKRSHLFPFTFRGPKVLFPTLHHASLTLIVQRVGTLHKRITSGPKLYIFCVCIITGKLTSFHNFTSSIDVSNVCVQSL